MNLVNATSMPADLAVALDVHGREHVVVIVKGTFLFPSDGGPAVPAKPEEQLPLVVADIFTGEPGHSAPVQEAEYCLRKPCCDVLLTAAAYAPNGIPTTRVRAGVRIGTWSKSLEVVGDRVWEQRGPIPGPSAPISFLEMPITYDRAFGGVDNSDPDRPDSFAANPIGRGHGLARSGVRLLGTPMPNTEDPREPVKRPWGGYRPVSLGPLGRGWQPRIRWAGTYDKHWVDEVFPFLPADFDDRYHQAAPEDQQIGFPAGGELVELVNLAPMSRLAFRLPSISMPMLLLRSDREDFRLRSVVDTISIQPEKGRLTLVWRASYPIRRDSFEVAEVLVGGVSRAWEIAHASGKAYYRSLDEAVRTRRREPPR